MVARYAIGLLHVQGFFDKPALSPSSSLILDPPRAVQLTTFATPHIGIPPAPTAFGRLASWIGGRMLSRTGEQLVSDEENLYLRLANCIEPILQD